MRIWIDGERVELRYDATDLVCDAQVPAPAPTPICRTTYDLARLVRMPRLWPALDPARHSITAAEQESLYRRVKQDLTPSELGDFNHAVTELRQVLSEAGITDYETISPLSAQFEYATLAQLAGRRITRAEHRILTTAWQAVATRPLLDIDSDAWDITSPGGVLPVRPKIAMNAATTQFPWGEMHVIDATDGPTTCMVSRGSTAFRLFLSMPYSGIPCGPVWIGLMPLVLLSLEIGGWAIIVWALISALISLPLVLSLRRDLYRVDPDGPVAYLLTLAREKRDGGMIEAALAAGWSWKDLNTWPAAEIAALAGQHTHGSLLGALLDSHWPMQHDTATELVQTALRALEAADRAGVIEANVEVQGLVLASRSHEDMRAATIVLSELATELEDLAVREASHRPPEITADSDGAHPEDDAAARDLAAASVVSTRRAVRLATERLTSRPKDSSANP